MPVLHLPQLVGLALGLDPEGAGDEQARGQAHVGDRLVDLGGGQRRLSGGTLDEALGDPARLATLRATELLDSEEEPEFDRLTRLAARVIGTPTAVTSLVDDERQFFKSCVGVPADVHAARGTPLTHSFCQHVVHGGEALVITDAREHPLVRENLAIRDLDVIAYLGVPIISSEGFVLGSFCAIDSQPREWSEDDIATLYDLAHAVMTEIHLREAARPPRWRAAG